MSHIARDCCKVSRVIDSCKTLDQVIMAFNMKCEFCKIYSGSKEGLYLDEKSLETYNYFWNKENAYEIKVSEL